MPNLPPSFVYIVSLYYPDLGAKPTRGKSQLQQIEKIQMRWEPDSGKCQAAPQTQLQASFFFFLAWFPGLQESSPEILPSQNNREKPFLRQVANWTKTSNLRSLFLLQKNT